jgi:predicted metal-binding membrane protein
MIAPRVQDYRPFLAVFASLIALCWLSLVVWDQSPYGAYLDHRILGDGGSALDRGYAGLALLFIAGWTLMTVAMMLPTVIPLLLIFRRLVAGRADARLLVVCLVAAYLAVWVVVGAAAHAGDLGVHALVERSHWLAERSGMLGVLILFLAGAYQFTALKRLCLDACRSPYAFIVGHWHGGNAKLDALRLGLHHGLFCVGCCWSLMLLMFALGAGNVVWMLALGAVMAAEKNLPWGRKLSAPLGVLLLAAGSALLIAQLTAGVACAHGGATC